MRQVVVVKKNGTCIEQCTTEKKLDVKAFSVLCGNRKCTKFDQRTSWEIDYGGVKYDVYLYAKNDGGATTVNKFEFPPPVDNDIYYGNCLLTMCEKNTDTLVDLSCKVWDHIYNILYGGFEDIGSESEGDDEDDEDDEYDDIPECMLTSDGYLKDDMIVDSDEEIEVESYDDELEEDSFVSSSDED